MKRILLMTAFFIFGNLNFAQSIQITEISAAQVTGGMNVNVKAISYNGAGYLDHTYSISGNTVELSVCYYFNMTLPVLTFNNDFFIPIESAGNYTVNVTVYNSASTDTCDYFSPGGTESTTVLSSADFGQINSEYKLFPNPTYGSMQFSGEATVISNIIVFDKLGRLVKTTNNPSSETVDFSELSSGSYIVKMIIDGKPFIQRILKK